MRCFVRPLATDRLARPEYAASVCGSDQGVFGLGHQVIGRQRPPVAPACAGKMRGHE